MDELGELGSKMVSVLERSSFWTKRRRLVRRSRRALVSIMALCRAQGGGVYQLNAILKRGPSALFEQGIRTRGLMTTY